MSDWRPFRTPAATVYFAVATVNGKELDWWGPYSSPEKAADNCPVDINTVTIVSFGNWDKP